MKLTPSQSVRVAAYILFLLAAFLLIVSAIQASHVIPLSYNEGWNASNLKRFDGSESPYVFSLWSVNNYPPLWYEIVSRIAQFSGQERATWIGRILGGFGTLVATITVFKLAKSARLSSTYASVAGSLFAVTILGIYQGYGILSDPQMPALAMMLLALLITSRSDGSLLHDSSAIALMIAAGFTKHSLLAIPLGSFLHWILTRPKRETLRNLVIALLLGTAAFAFAYFAYGTGFFESLFRSPRYYSAAVGAFKVANWVSALPVLFLAFLFLLFDRGLRDNSTTGLYVCVATVATLITVFTAGGGGTSYNLAFELIALCCVLCPIALSRMEESVTRAGFFALLSFLLVSALTATAPTAKRLISGSLGAFNEEEEATSRAVKLLKALPAGEIICSSPILCIWAERSSATDWYTMWQGALSHRISGDDLESRIGQSAVTGLEIRVDALDGLNSASAERDRFISALNKLFVPTDSVGGSVLYRRRDHVPSQTP